MAVLYSSQRGVRSSFRFDRLLVCLFSRFSSQVSTCLVLNNFLLRFLLDFKSSVRRPMKSTQLRWVVRWMSFGRLFQTESTWEYFIVWSSICYRVTFENSNFQHFIDNLVTWQKQTRTHRFINGFFQPTTTLRQALDVFELSLSTIRQLFLLLLCCSVPLGFFQLISSIIFFSDSATVLVLTRSLLLLSLQWFWFFLHPFRFFLHPNVFQ